MATKKSPFIFIIIHVYAIYVGLKNSHQIEVRKIQIDLLVRPFFGNLKPLWIAVLNIDLSDR